VKQLLNPKRSAVYNADPSTLRTPIDGQVASDMQDMMVSVVEHGTGQKAQINGFKVGGKTGTAQNGFDKNGNELDPHGWFIGFAFNSKGEPVSAACVMLENVPGGHASAEAARIAGLIMKAASRGGS
jgi:peptidoglycan glycosyltransferase